MIKTIEIIYFKKLKEVHREFFKRHTKMFSKNYIILNMNNIHYIIIVMLSQIL